MNGDESLMMNDGDDDGDDGDGDDESSSSRAPGAVSIRGWVDGLTY